MGSEMCIRDSPSTAAAARASTAAKGDSGDSAREIVDGGSQIFYAARAGDGLLGSGAPSRKGCEVGGEQEDAVTGGRQGGCVHELLRPAKKHHMTPEPVRPHTRRHSVIPKRYTWRAC